MCKVRSIHVLVGSASPSSILRVSFYLHLSANVDLIRESKNKNSNSTMPPRKEPKEQVIYPSSRTKTPAFKPLRRIPTTESQPSVPTKATPKTKTASSKAPTTSKSKRPIVLPDSEQEEESDDDLTLSTNKNATSKPSDDGEENEEEEEPHKKTTTTSTAPKRKASEISSLDSSTDHHHHQQPPNREPPTSLFLLSNEEEEEEDLATTTIPSIPQPLLLRLLHEGFHHKDTKIDTRALGMVQQYVEIFVREMIARCVAEKKERMERKEKQKEKGEGDEEMRMDDDDDDDVGWLDLEDLEKVGVGMMLDF